MKRIVGTMLATYEMALVCPRRPCACPADAEPDFGAQDSSPHLHETQASPDGSPGGPERSGPGPAPPQACQFPARLRASRHERVFLWIRRGF